MFHVALKFQYLHTSALPPCTFALATLKTPGGGQRPGRNKGHKRRQWWAHNAHHVREGYAPPPQPRPAPASGAPPVVPARAPAPVPVVVIPDDGVPAVSGVSAQNPRPKHKAMPGKPKAKAMPYHLTTKPKVKAKPKAQPGVAGVSGVAGTKRKSSRSPSAGVKRKTAVRLEAASASSAPSNSGASATPVSLRKPLQGETFMIYSGGMSQASNKNFQSPS